MRPWETIGSTRSLGLARIFLGLLTYAEVLAMLRPAHHLQHLDIMALSGIPWLSVPALIVGWHARSAAAVTGITLLALHTWGGMQGLTGAGLPWASVTIWELAITLCVLALTPCGRSFSVDRWLAPEAERAPLWGHALIRVHTSVIFGALAVSHLTPLWWSGERLARMGMARHGVPIEAGPLMSTMAVIWVALELLCCAAPWVARQRLVPIGLGFVLLQYPMLYTGTWSLHAAVLLLLCLDPDSVDRTIQDLSPQR